MHTETETAEASKKMRQTTTSFLLLVLASICSAQVKKDHYFRQSDGTDEDFPPPGQNNMPKFPQPEKGNRLHFTPLAYNIPKLPSPGEDFWGHIVHRGNQPEQKPDQYGSKSDVTADIQSFNTEILYNLGLVPCPHAHIPDPG